MCSCFVSAFLAAVSPLILTFCFFSPSLLININHAHAYRVGLVCLIRVGCFIYRLSCLPTLSRIYVLLVLFLCYLTFSCIFVSPLAFLVFISSTSLSRFSCLYLVRSNHFFLICPVFPILSHFALSLFIKSSVAYVYPTFLIPFYLSHLI